MSADAKSMQNKRHFYLSLKDYKCHSGNSVWANSMTCCFP